MRLTPALLFTALVALGSTPARAQDAPASKDSTWVGKSIVLTRVGNRSMAAACETLAQIDHFERERAHKWDDASIGCRFVLAGNFTAARVLEQSGAYLHVKFDRLGFPPTYTLWVPRANFRPAA
ncbi:MAG TPA: hypothetical protein VFN38_07990 [Gemmatimonadaceae bacterium]|nr:hypothetical protein [Gemmatimonadaceae bacterium]